MAGKCKSCGCSEGNRCLASTTPWAGEAPVECYMSQPDLCSICDPDATVERRRGDVEPDTLAAYRRAREIQRELELPETPNVFPRDDVEARVARDAIRILNANNANERYDYFVVEHFPNRALEDQEKLRAAFDSVDASSFLLPLEGFAGDESVTSHVYGEIDEWSLRLRRSYEELWRALRDPSRLPIGEDDPNPFPDPAIELFDEDD